MFETNANGILGLSSGPIVNEHGELVGIAIAISCTVGNEMGATSGAKIGNALNYINNIAAKKAAELF